MTLDLFTGLKLLYICCLSLLPPVFMDMQVWLGCSQEACLQREGIG